jgi:hypothetical protein
MTVPAAPFQETFGAAFPRYLIATMAGAVC